MRYYIAVFITLLFFGSPAVSTHFNTQVKYISKLFDDTTFSLASVIFANNPRTLAEIKSHYYSTDTNQIAPINKVRILLVPGHEPNNDGTVFKNIKERELAVELAQDLQGFLETDPHFQIFLTRDNNDWMPEIKSYFKDHWQDIIDWENGAKLEEQHLVSIGSSTKEVPIVIHNSASRDVALRLYGINRWANENRIDITLHIHFNDDGLHEVNSPGNFNGFVMYIPSNQYLNNTTSKTIGQKIFNRLSKYNPVSDLSVESGGIVPDPDLIATGAHNTSDAASMLIEYGYIYEPQFSTPEVKNLAVKDLAYQTYLGLEDFFDSAKSAQIAQKYDTLILPYKWTDPISVNKIGDDVFALQTALVDGGFYPPNNISKNDCPRTGKYGPCTMKAVTNFQTVHKINEDKGKVGQKTIDVLNDLYSAKVI